MNLPTTILLDCQRCAAIHRVDVHQDGNGAYANITTTPCAECALPLCADCPQFTCDCGVTICLHHGVAFEGSLWCHPCIDAMLKSDEACVHVVELESEEELDRIQVLQEAGCTLDEFRSLSRITKGEPS
jgi:hypothetical protein